MFKGTEDSGKPVFVMPACSRHFFQGHKWWCKECDKETEKQYKELFETWWYSQLGDV